MNPVHKLLAKHPKKVPIILQRDLYCNDLPELSRQKYLVPLDVTVSHFLYYIRRQLSVPPHISIFIYVNQTLPSLQQPMSLLYEEEQSSDGILYFYYASEHTFG